MKKITMLTNCILALVLVGGLVTAGPVLAEKLPWAGGKSGKHERKQKHGSVTDHGRGYLQDRYDIGLTVYFSDRHRYLIRSYYAEQYRRGHCPPGLAKKKNGCMPPGQARKWHLGRPLPRNVIFHDLPSSLMVQLGPPPAGHRFVRVASDILLITVGTGMIVDAITDLHEIK